MATNKIVFEIDVKSGQLKKATQTIGKNTKAIKDQEKTQKKATKSANNYDKQNKSLYQSNLSSAKSFSKMNQTIGGSGGSGALVASYAVLAANVFAVTAAFNTLRTAAASEKLAEGLVAFSNSTGQSLDLVARKLQETTGHAVSFDMAMRTAALSTSAGFGVAEMEGLTRVAKGASLALGRDMGDALDRLTRGAIKLEPEILDELGIMVRLDDATENYAATLGKSATQLTRFERQQAFMNAIITEGEVKFGAIADSIDPNSYDQLSAAFADLSKVVLNLLNSALIPLINFMVSSPGIFLGAVAMFSGGIAKRMIPALGDMSARSLEAAKNSQAAVAGILKSSEAQAAGAEQAIQPIDGLNTKYNDLVKDFKGGERTTKNLSNMKRSLSASINGLEKKIKTAEAAGEKAERGDKSRLKTMKSQRKQLDLLTTGRAADIGMVKLELEMSNAYTQAKMRESEVIALAGTQVFTYREAMTLSIAVIKGAAFATYEYLTAQLAAIKSTTALSFASKLLRGGLALLKTAFFAASISAKAFGTALLNMLPFIGQIIIMATFAIDIIKGLLKFIGIGTDEQKAYKDSLKDLTTVLDGIPDKMEELNKQQERASHTTQLMINKYKILGGLLKTVFDQALEAEKKAVEAGEYNSFLFGEGEKRVGTIDGSGVEKINEKAGNLSPMIQSVQRLNKESEDFAKFAEKRLGKSLDQFIAEMSDGDNTVQQIAESMKVLLDDGVTAFSGLSEAAAGMSRTFEESEKVTQKFFRGMVQSTKFDGISTQFKVLTNDLMALKKEAQEAGEDPLAFVGEAALKMGKGMKMLMGPELIQQVEQASKIQAEITKEQEALRQETNLKEIINIKNRIKLLQGKFKTANKDVAKVIMDQLPVTQGILDNLKSQTIVTKKEIKFMDQRKKALMGIAKNEFTILAAKSIDDANNKRRVNLLKTEVQIKRGMVADALKAQAMGKVLNDDQRNVLADNKARLEEIATLENKISESSVSTAEAKVAGLKADQASLSTQMEISKLITDNNAKFSKIVALSQGLSFTSIESAVVELTNAESEYDLAVKERNMRMEVIKAEFELLAAKGALESSRNIATILELEKEKTTEMERQARILELQKKGEGEFMYSPFGVTPGHEDPLQHVAGRTNEEESELNQLMAGSRPDIQSDIDALKVVNNAIVQTYDTQLDALKLTAQKTAEEILSAAFDSEIKIKEALGGVGDAFLQSGGGLGLASAMAVALGPTQLEKVASDLTAKLDEMRDEDGNMAEGLSEADKAQFEQWQIALNKIEKITESTTYKMSNHFANMGTVISSIFGEDGAMLAGLSNLTATMITSFDTMKGGFTGLKDIVDKETGEITTKNDQIAEKLQAVGNIIAQVGALAAQSAKQRVAGVDREIEAEKKKDGKSKESLAKIAGLEKKKEAIERKAFERNKKIQMAQVIVNTAAGIMKTIGETGFFGLPLALIIGAMGAAQLSMIAGTSYQGGGGSAGASVPSSIQVGKRDNKVDVSKGASAGETAYLRGQTGMGSNANSFIPGAASGMKSYASGGDVLVGERGPEVISPISPFEVTPNDKIGGTSNVNFTINAVDAAGVQDLLQAQRGNIIGMIREAAHEHGEEFMDSVNTEVYN